VCPPVSGRRIDFNPDVQIAGCARIAIKPDGITTYNQVFNLIKVHQAI
jgi:hypothetical protein